MKLVLVLRSIGELSLGMFEHVVTESNMIFISFLLVVIAYHCVVLFNFH